MARRTTPDNKCRVINGNRPAYCYYHALGHPPATGPPAKMAKVQTWVLELVYQVHRIVNPIDYQS